MGTEGFEIIEKSWGSIFKSWVFIEKDFDFFCIFCFFS